MFSNIPDGLLPGLPQELNSALRARTPALESPSVKSLTQETQSEAGDFPRRVLLVEPSPSERARLRSVLVAGQLEVATASDLITALHALSIFQPNLILAQMRLPTHGGLGLLRQIKEHCSTRPIPVILYGSTAMVEERIAALNSGAADLISEPFVSAELLARVRASLRAQHRFFILEKRAHLDGLTGLANRGVLEDHLLREWSACDRRGVPLAVVVLDVDFFKSINDTYGHAAGDEVLRQTAKRLAQSVRSSDLVARYGGEEFVIVSPDCSRDAAIAMTQRFRASLAERTISAAGADIAVTVSAGIALSNQARQHTPEELFHQADVALYCAKTAGRNAVWVYNEPTHGGPSAADTFTRVGSG
jgi:diguanylate cyclase (GGDEF)-like protein